MNEVARDHTEGRLISRSEVEDASRLVCIIYQACRNENHDARRVGDCQKCKLLIGCPVLTIRAAYNTIAESPLGGQHGSQAS